MVRPALVIVGVLVALALHASCQQAPDLHAQRTGPSAEDAQLHGPLTRAVNQRPLVRVRRQFGGSVDSCHANCELMSSQQNQFSSGNRNPTRPTNQNSRPTNQNSRPTNLGARPFNGRK